MLQAIGGFVMLVANGILISHTLINSYALGNPNNSKHDGGYQDVELPFENGKGITIPSPKFMWADQLVT
jgi:hypothetical protein